MNVSCKCSELSYEDGVVGSDPSGIESLSSETSEFIDMRSVSSITSSKKQFAGDVPLLAVFRPSTVVGQRRIKQDRFIPCILDAKSLTYIYRSGMTDCTSTTASTEI